MAGIEMCSQFVPRKVQGSCTAALHSGRHKRQHTPQSPTVVPFMAGELVGVAQKSKSPPSLVFLGVEKAEFPRGGGWKGRCGRGNDWLRMEEGIRERKGRRGRYLLR